MTNIKKFELDNNYNLIDIYSFIKTKYPYITISEYGEYYITFEELDIIIYIPNYKKSIAGFRFTISGILFDKNEAKYETYQSKLENLDYFRDNIKNLEKELKYDEIEKIKNIKYISYNEQECLFEELKNIFRYKKIPKSNNIFEYIPIDKKEILLKGLYDYNIYNYYFEHELNKIFEHREATEDENQREEVKIYKKMLVEYLSKPEIQKELKELENMQVLWEKYKMENYLKVKDLNGNIVDPRKVFKDYPINSVKYLYIYTAKEAVAKIKELESKGEL